MAIHYIFIYRYPFGISLLVSSVLGTVDTQERVVVVMREIKLLGTYKKEGASRSYQYALFKCPECGLHVEKIRKDGRKAKYCSHSCYSLNRIPRGSYKKYVVIAGYKYIYLPHHPHRTKSGYVAEHRLVVEENSGRYLPRDCDIHHLDGNKMNNDVDNLVMLSKSEHSRISALNRKRRSDGRFTI